MLAKSVTCTALPFLCPRFWVQYTWIYFLYIMTSISLLLPVYLNIFGVVIYRYTFEILDYLQILNIIFYEIIIDNFFNHIIFFLEIILPIVYFKNYK